MKIGYRSLKQIILKKVDLEDKQIRNEIQVIRLRGHLNPKRFYQEIKKIPDRYQAGTVLLLKKNKMDFNENL